MKIAYICADPGIPVLGNKGASVHVREFTNALVELGHQVRIYSAAGTATDENNLSVNTTRADLTVLAPSAQTRSTALLLADGMARLTSRDHFHLFLELRRVVGDPEFVNRARPLVRDFAPDLVIARHALFSTAALALAQTSNCPCVLEVNAPIVDERRRYWDLTLEREAEQIETQVFAGADLLIAVSEGVRAYLQRYGAPREHILVLPNGVNLSRFQPNLKGDAVRHRYGLESKIVIGFAGSLKPWHGVDLLLHAFTSVYQVLRGHEKPGSAGLALFIIGDGPQRAQLEQLSRELGISETVTFTGAVPHSEMPEYLAAVDIAVAPYLGSDGFYFSPLKVMEYMAMGRATIAPMLGQLPSLLQDTTGACGLLYPPDDQPELAHALLRLVRDAELRNILGTRAAAQAQRRSSWQTIAQQIIERAACMTDRIETRQLELSSPEAVAV
jgi:glycosyltransferase involved in cell wall biosynthesis